MSFGGGTTYQTTTPTLTPEQTKQIQLENTFFENTVLPAYKDVVGGEQNLMAQNQNAVQAAAQNMATQATQAQNVLGTTGETALRTGITGLQSLFSPNYEAQQLSAALLPAQAQYAQNIANQTAQFGGAGQLGSARSQLAQAQTAGQAEAAQMMAAADVENKIAQQRMAAGQSLMSGGLTGISGAQQAAQNAITASMTPQALYNQYANVLFGTPSQAWSPNFAGTQTVAQTGGGSQWGINLRP